MPLAERRGESGLCGPEDPSAEEGASSEEGETFGLRPFPIPNFEWKANCDGEVKGEGSIVGTDTPRA